MSNAEVVQGRGSEKEARAQMKLQIAQYVAQQPESTQQLHRWMKIFEAASLGLIAAVFVAAMYVSIRWESVPVMLIPAAWMIFAVSGAPCVILIGLHSVFLQAYPPVLLPQKTQQFYTGRKAAGIGWGWVVFGLAVSIFWGYFVYSLATLNLSNLEPLIRIFGAVLGIGITLSIVYSVFRQFKKHL